MKIGVKELKSRYNLLVSNGVTIKSCEMSLDVPISSGSPVVDSFLLEKIQPSKAMASYEHLARSWQLIKNASDSEIKALMKNLKGCLNDHKALLAAWLLSEKQEDEARAVLNSLPFSWRLIFPLVFAKPAHVFFDGWKKDLQFNLVDKWKFTTLRDLYREILQNASDVAIVKHRRQIHEVTATLGYKFETPREKAIENWCYYDGKNASAIPLVQLYVNARNALNSKGETAFVDVLYKNEQVLPLTSLMGLLSLKNLTLNNETCSLNEKLQNYAVQSATPIEAALHLNEWSPWLQNSHYDILTRKIKLGALDVNVPFSKITQAYLTIPKKTRENLTDTLFIPLLENFALKVSHLLPEKFTFFQPVNFINIDNFLLFNIFNASSKGTLVLAGESEDYNYKFTVEELKNAVNMDYKESKKFLQRNFKKAEYSQVYTYSNQRILQSLSKLDPESLLIYNAPFFESLDVIDKLRQWEKVINLSTYCGAPTEISIKYSYEDIVNIRDTRRNLRVATIDTDPTAYKAVNYLEKLHWFEKLAKEVN